MNSLTSEQLITSGLADQVSAIAGYERVIWKLRVGYVLVLNGALALILKGSGNPLDILSTLKYSHPLFAVVCGISLTFFFIDFGYVRKKLKFVVARELLIDLACRPVFDPETDEVKVCLKEILHIAGEIRPTKLPPGAKSEYKGEENLESFLDSVADLHRCSIAMPSLYNHYPDSAISVITNCKKRVH